MTSFHRSTVVLFSSAPVPFNLPSTLFPNCAFLAKKKKSQRGKSKRGVCGKIVLAFLVVENINCIIKEIILFYFIEIRLAPCGHFLTFASLRVGVRYFMIKSWNYDNVIAAQRESLWATQAKNEETLTEAFRTSRHVILLFSVNKSIAFQGYVSVGRWALSS